MGHESTAATPTQNGYDLWVGKLVGSGDHWTHLKSSEGPSCNSGPMLGIDMRCVATAAATATTAALVRCRSRHLVLSTHRFPAALLGPRKS